MEVIILESPIVPPYGMAGGAPGECGRNWVERTDGSREEMTAMDKEAWRRATCSSSRPRPAAGFGPATERVEPLPEAAE